MALNGVLPTTTTRRLLRVAVIGAGPSGLVACRHLAAEPDRFEFVCYEQCPSIGGAWYYAEDNEDYDNDNAAASSEQGPKKSASLQSCIYKNLRTNSPVESFVCPGYSFTDEHFIPPKNKNDPQLRSFITHEEVLLYLRSYAQHYKLMNFIRLNNSVQSVRRVNPDDLLQQQQQYCVTAVHTLTGEQSVETFDAVIVCNGHYAKAKWPTIKNLEMFQGKLMHTKFYRHPQQFSTCKKIIVMGGGYSGIDIVLDLEFKSKAKKDLIFSAHDVVNLGPNFSSDCKNIRLKSDVVEIIGPNEVKFADGTSEKNVDALLIGTGYYYDFPFLSHSDGLALKVEGQRLMPLYKHVVHIDYPTVGFIGMVWSGLTIPQFDMQVKYFLAFLRGEFELPGKKEMLAWTEQDLLKRTDGLKWPKRHAHKIGHIFAPDYNDSLVSESGIAPMDASFLRIDKQAEVLRRLDQVKFKLKNYNWSEMPEGQDLENLFAKSSS